VPSIRAAAKFFSPLRWLDHYRIHACHLSPLMEIATANSSFSSGREGLAAM
jgi:hypothetical protein